MSYAEAAAIVLASTLGAAVLGFLVHRTIPVATRRTHHEVGSAVFLQLGVLFAVLLAFVFSEAYSQFGEAERAINLECGALHAAAMLSSTFPPAQARDLLSLQAEYLDDVVRIEWPQMREDRNSSDAAVAALTRLIQHVAQLHVQDAADTTVKAELLSVLAELHAQREVRLYQAGNGLPTVLWAVLIGFSLLLMSFVACSSLERFGSLALLTGTFAGCVSAILVVVRLLDYPFEGAISLTPQDFAATLGKVAALLAQIH